MLPEQGLFDIQGIAVISTREVHFQLPTQGRGHAQGLRIAGGRVVAVDHAIDYDFGDVATIGADDETGIAPAAERIQGAFDEVVGDGIQQGGRQIGRIGHADGIRLVAVDFRMGDLHQVVKIGGTDADAEGDVGILLDIGFPGRLTGQIIAAGVCIGHIIVQPVAAVRLAVGDEIDQVLIGRRRRGGLDLGIESSVVAGTATGRQCIDVIEGSLYIVEEPAGFRRRTGEGDDMYVDIAEIVDFVDQGLQRSLGHLES